MALSAETGQSIRGHPNRAERDRLAERSRAESTSTSSTVRAQLLTCPARSDGQCKSTNDVTYAAQGHSAPRSFGSHDGGTRTQEAVGGILDASAASAVLRRATCDGATEEESGSSVTRIDDVKVDLGKR